MSLRRVFLVFVVLVAHCYLQRVFEWFPAAFAQLQISPQEKGTSVQHRYHSMAWSQRGDFYPKPKMEKKGGKRNYSKTADRLPNFWR